MWFFRRKNYTGVLAKDPVDVRDYQLSSIQPKGIDLPEEFDLRGVMPSIQHQNWGTCTSHGVDAIKEFLDSKQYGKVIKLSQKFIYINTKRISGLWNIQGDYVRNALKSVCQYGACLEETFPDIKRLSWNAYVKDVPSEEAYKEAEKYKGKTFWAVGKELEDFRQAIYQQKAPITFSMMWNSSYNKVASDGKLALPSGEAGGHAMACAGWTKDKLWVHNSWGTNFGEDGYFYIPFDEFNKHNIWNAYILLDKEAVKDLTGWVANKYLKQSEGFKLGTKVVPTYRLNLRTKPTTNSAKIITLKRGQQCEVIDNEVINAQGLKWQKIKTFAE